MPKKFLIIGVSASGKSTFARRLSDKTKIPVFFVDSIMWKPNWKYIGDEKTTEILNEIGQNNEWIIEGYITKEARPFLFERADQIIYLDYSPIVCVYRYIKRCWKHRKNARPELQGSPDKFSFKFLRTIWSKWEVISLEKLLTEIPIQNKTIKLKSPKEAKIFLDKIGLSLTHQQ